MRKRKSNRGEIVQAFAMLTQIALAMMSSMAISLFIGWWLDRLCGTRFIIAIMLVIGIAASIKSMFTITKGLIHKQEKAEDSDIGDGKKKSD